MFSNLGCPILLTILVCPILRSDFEAEPRPDLLDFKGMSWGGRVDWKERPGRDETVKEEKWEVQRDREKRREGEGNEERVSGIDQLLWARKTSSGLTFKL